MKICNGKREEKRIREEEIRDRRRCLKMFAGQRGGPCLTESLIGGAG